MNKCRQFEFLFPATRENKAPVAIIKPENLQVKLPNSAILDGSESTDDDKIVSYHWEEVSGPLRDQKITDDAAILTLENLAPGNYTFKYVPHNLQYSDRQA